ncbi:MAG: TetR/AcrR family transcriptional regulator [Actinomycetota bacterium]|nr:TetR/AcrR family transcriptional regulator [Actinomycetota bacterium]
MVRPRGRPPGGGLAHSTEELLDRALEAFAERGYEGTSVRELARDLGVSHNLIPQRLGSKEDLWFAAVDRGFGFLAVELTSVLVEVNDADDDLARLRALVRRFIEANARRPALLQVISREAVSPGPRLDHIFDTFIAPVRDFGDDLLRRLRAEGKVRNDSVSILYFLMTHGGGGAAALPGLAARLGAPVDPSDDAAIRAHAAAVTEIIFDGLGVGRRDN